MQITNSNIKPTKANAEIPDRTMNAAREFEAIFTNIMLKAMRGKENKDGLIPSSTGERIYTEMLDTEYSKILANNASFGLAEQIAKQIVEMENGGKTVNNKLNSIRLSPTFIENSVSNNPENYYRSPVASVERWSKDIEDAAKIYGVDSTLVAAVIRQESGGNQYAVSGAGAKGLMQLMDGTASDLGVKRVYNGRENIMGGTKYLGLMLDKFKGNERLALAAYNAGPGNVIKYGDIPPYKETQDYVKKVLAFRDLELAKIDLSKGVEYE